MQDSFTPPRSIDTALIAQIESFGKDCVQLVGDLNSTSPTASFRIEGRFEGNIRFPAGGVVHIANGAVFTNGTIEADYVYVEGSVHGDIRARKCVEVVPTADVIGTIFYDADLDLHKNVRIRGGLNFLGFEQGAETIHTRSGEASNDLDGHSSTSQPSV